jgi:hypothetical protein
LQPTLKTKQLTKRPCEAKLPEAAKSIAHHASAKPLMYVTRPTTTPRGYIQRGAENFSHEARQMLFSFMIDSPEEITHNLGDSGPEPQIHEVDRARTSNGPS